MILITGAGGQIGTVLTKALQQRFGRDQVLATDIRKITDFNGQFELLDITDKNRLIELVEAYKVQVIYHLASILSAKGEAMPIPTWDINMGGLLNVLEVAANHQLDKVFFPSSIAVFGKETNLKMTPQFGALLPTTVYGITKVAGELWAQYYFEKKGLDVRSVRFPGIIGYDSLPGGGTTDYAVEIYHAAIQNQAFQCYISEDEKMPMMYMDDAIRAVLEIMDAPKESIKVRTSYNIASMSFSPKEIYAVIRKFKPDFKIVYQPDFREEIAKAWPDQFDDQAARKDWGWSPKFDLDTMTKDMFYHLDKKLAPSS